MILIIMGVCGSGKSVIGKRLATKLGWVFSDGDEFHSAENKGKMSHGVPLEDEDRWPWLESIHKQMKLWASESRHGVITCSALRKCYRDVLIHGTSGKSSSDSKDSMDHHIGKISSKNVFLTNELNSSSSISKSQRKGKPFAPGDIIFVYLHGDNDLLMNRLAKRQDHFMPASLLASQLALYEPLTSQEPHIIVDISKSEDIIVDDIITKCHLN